MLMYGIFRCEINENVRSAVVSAAIANADPWHGMKVRQTHLSLPSSISH